MKADSEIRHAQHLLVSLLATPKNDDLSELTLREALQSLERALEPEPEASGVETVRELGVNVSVLSPPAPFSEAELLRRLPLPAPTANSQAVIYSDMCDEWRRRYLRLASLAYPFVGMDAIVESVSE